MNAAILRLSKSPSGLARSPGSLQAPKIEVDEPRVRLSLPIADQLADLS